jgi:hypothetical protein
MTEPKPGALSINARAAKLLTALTDAAGAEDAAAQSKHLQRGRGYLIGLSPQQRGDVIKIMEVTGDSSPELQEALNWLAADADFSLGKSASEEPTGGITSVTYGPLKPPKKEEEPDPQFMWPEEIGDKVRSIMDRFARGEIEWPWALEEINYYTGKEYKNPTEINRDYPPKARPVPNIPPAETPRPSLPPPSTPKPQIPEMELQPPVLRPPLR